MKRKCQEHWTPAQEQTSKIAKIARDWLRNTGWQQRRGGWTHSVLQKRLQTDFPNHQAWNFKQAQHTAHLCREGWRTQQWDAFLKSGRRESRAIGMRPYQEQRFCHDSNWLSAQRALVWQSSMVQESARLVSLCDVMSKQNKVYARTAISPVQTMHMSSGDVVSDRQNFASIQLKMYCRPALAGPWVLKTPMALLCSNK